MLKLVSIDRVQIQPLLFYPVAIRLVEHWQTILILLSSYSAQRTQLWLYSELMTIKICGNVRQSIFGSRIVACWKCFGGMSAGSSRTIMVVTEYWHDSYVTYVCATKYYAIIHKTRILVYKLSATWVVRFWQPVCPRDNRYLPWSAAVGRCELVAVSPPPGSFRMYPLSTSFYTCHWMRRRWRR